VEGTKIGHANSTKYSNSNGTLNFRVLLSVYTHHVKIGPNTIPQRMPDCPGVGSTA
jgi:hypothetical protein